VIKAFCASAKQQVCLNQVRLILMKFGCQT